MNTSAHFPIRSTAVAVLASVLCLGLPASGESPSAVAPLIREDMVSQRIVFQTEWATSLASVLGLSPVLSEDPTAEEVFALLCADRAERTIESGGMRLPVESAYRIAVDAPRGETATAPIRVVVNLPAPAVYMLSVEGTGPQRWTVDQRPVGHLDPTSLGIAQAPILMPLRGGPHELSAYLARSSRVDRVELAAYWSMCISPSEGWSSTRPLTYADKARTIVQALRIEERLPKLGNPIEVEAEQFFEASTWGARTNRVLDEPASANAWVVASGSAAEFSYRIRIDDPGIFTIKGRIHGGGTQLWSIDGRFRRTVNPDLVTEGFNWNNVTTMPLLAGEHVIRVLLPAGAGLDTIKLVRHDSTDDRYISLIEEAGFWGGAPGAYVTRTSAFKSLSNPTLAETSQHFLDHLATGDKPIFLVEHNVDDLYAHPLSPVLPPEL